MKGQLILELSKRFGLILQFGGGRYLVYQDMVRTLNYFR